LKKTVLIIGANSDVAKEIARLYAKKEYGIELASRDMEMLDLIAVDLKTRSGVEVVTHYLDVTDFKSHDAFISGLSALPSVVVSAAGYMGKKDDMSSDNIKLITDINYTGQASILEKIAHKMRDSKHTGVIVGISSVAGERGRKANYIYGSAKAAFTSYLSGLRNAMYQYNIHVLTVKPGFIDTKMTQGLDLPAMLTAQPDEVANDIVRAVENKKNIIYTKWIWKYIMLVIKCIPEFQFKKMSI